MALIDKLSAIGDAIREKNGTTDLIPLGDMPAAIEAIQTGGELPEEAFLITGSCPYKFSGSGWNWFIELYGNQITTNNISNASYMFSENPLSSIPFTIHFALTAAQPQYMFNNSSIESLPKFVNFLPGDSAFAYCKKLTSLNGLKIERVPTQLPVNGLFSNCYKLRTIGDFFVNVPDIQQGNSIFGMYNVFQSCYSIDELTDLPFIYGTYGSTYSFGSCFAACFRLKEVTFRGGTVAASNAKPNSLMLSSYTGWSSSASSLTNIGFTADKRITDAATYQALKDDPDSWTTDVNYSRYNHTSAVNTINSLPDVTAISGGNTIRFKGSAGSLTDGGAISNLTEEEIAVATAKGWTITLE